MFSLALLIFISATLQDGVHLREVPPGFVPIDEGQKGSVPLELKGPGGFVPIGTNMKAQEPIMFKAPSFCHDLECPKYTVVATNQDYEVRKYEPSVWVAVTQTGLTTFNRSDQYSDFMSLFHYISGNNSANQKIAMTAPVLKIFEMSNTGNMTVTMMFMVPFALQTNPPQPTESKVYIKRYPEETVYVKSYGGFAKSYDIEKASELKASIGDASKYESNMFVMAGYDAPYSFIRHNEVWLKAV